MQKSIGSDVHIVAFNTSADVASDVTVVNTSYQLKPAIGTPMEALRDLIERTCPAQMDRLIAHVRGEFESTPDSFDRNVTRHVRLTNSFLAALETHAPDHVFLWNQFNALHRHFAHILDLRGIPRSFFHDGLLPGSIAMDLDGEMGESWIARDPERFQAIPVTSDDRGRAADFLAHLKTMDLHRHVQVDGVSVQEMIAINRRHDRPLVFYAGQADWHAGLRPDGPDRALHSPFYKSSLEALADLDRLAGEMGFYLLFKPHPLSRDRHVFLAAEDYPNTLILSSVTLQSCIDAAQVVVTIASQTCYVALMAGKPVVMLGRNQLTGKGLTYDLQARDALADTLLRALSDPLGADRAENLADHVARLEQIYLFDYGTLDVNFYRRGAEAAADLVRSCVAPHGTSPQDVLSHS